jgi:chromosome segregation protein
LNHNGLGRGAFVPLQPRWTPDAVDGKSPEWWPLLEGQPGVVGRALDVLQAGIESRGVLACLFDGVVIVNSLQVAMALWERRLWSAPDGPTLATIDGEVLDAAGVVTGGTAGTTGGLLLRRREVQRLEEERAALAHALELNKQDRDRLSAQRDAKEADLHQLDDTIRGAEMQMLGLVKDEAALQQRVNELAGRVDTIRAEHRADDEERSRIETDIAVGRNQVARLHQDKAIREIALGELRGRLRAIDEEHTLLQQRLTDSRLTLASLGAGLEHCRMDVARLVKSQEERDARVRAHEQQLMSCAEMIQVARAERDRNEHILHDLDQRAVQLRHALTAAQEDHAAWMETIQQVERGLAAVREAFASSRGVRTSVEVRRAEVTTQLAVRESTLTGTYQLALESALAQEQADQKVRAEAEVEVGSGTAVDDSAMALRAQLQKIRDRIERMGPINLAAIEEHRELDERYRFLTAQEEDLSRSVSSLREIINRINRTTKDMFGATFNELQQKFREVFGRFFPGGRAELVLTEPQSDDEDGSGAQEPGIDIVAQPPGKRLKSIAMLSGGEKTLTAMALIFASFLIRPTPFCILDEIDAPLDEENIGRFTDVLTELAGGAQFIVVTHNKRTMAVADSLFGVTMEEPGVSKLVSVRLGDLQAA